MTFNIYTIYRPAPSVVKKDLARRLASQRSLLGKNNFAVKQQNTLVLDRKFTSSPYYFVNEDLEQGVDPYSTYGQSPIGSDVEESTEKLADKYIGNPSGLISEQTGKMESLSEKSKIFISELLQDRGLERSKLQPSELEPFDKETKEIIDGEGELSKSELNRIASIRDDALDLIAGRSRSHDSDYESDYESDTSVNRIQDEYSNLDSNTAEIINDHSRFIHSALQSLAYNYANDTLDPQNFNSAGEPSSTVETNTTVEAGPSNFNPAISDYDGITGPSKKRKREDTEVEISAKKPKVGDSTMDVDNAPSNIPSNNQSPLDYVLEKQQCDLYDISDDID